MRSSDRSEVLNLERDLPTTAEDVEALRQVRMLAPLDLDSYLRFLSQLPPPAATDLAAKRAPKGYPVFELPR